MTHPTLYQRIGGDSVVKPAVTLFYRRVLEDPALGRYFEGVDMARLRAHQRAFVSVVLGGPELFVGRPLHEAHRGLQIDDSAFDAMVDHLVAALRDLGAEDEVAARIAEELEPFRSDIVVRNP